MGDTSVPSFLASSVYAHVSLLEAIIGEDRGPSSEKQWNVRLKSQIVVIWRESVNSVVAEWFHTDTFGYLKLVGLLMKNNCLDTQSISPAKTSVPNGSALIYLGHLSRIFLKWLSHNMSSEGVRCHSGLEHICSLLKALHSTALCPPPPQNRGKELPL